MKQIVKFMILFSSMVLLIHQTNGFATFNRNATHEDYPGKCYYAGPPVTALSPGVTKRIPGACAKLKCHEGFDLYVEGCGVTAVPESCHSIAGDVSKPYPHCCPEIVC